ncbi:bifunctional 2-polyprenyl-6-hydroxyphenol methylase/3-demethylubiquinol 3-O-methyltransferase UbiG [Streptomyces sp. VRA16 Mangrove soil]|uniref:class I SAM-dependent methyltransferase n=1 Tax=Streptomyces sp. VRA16 Mangrove soil TaxID=2817434 RepID=UPI001A9DFC43|nr:class I SAM-dependent methyltransferase [Streptomyces sp. VRA16 Mangrove soil]MBO1333707.1 class I SAM-dependent methyltransferase [Streptomyces sp. VRA16 Mangrove soil]
MPSTTPPAPGAWPALREANRRRWDERVPLHLASDFYNVDSFRAGQDALRAFEVDEIGADVAGRSLLHLQCHIGTDTLSWLRHGAARVVGLDFSEPAVDAARDLAAGLGIDRDRALFVASDVYDAVSAVPDKAYDVVYTGVGALCWLHDIRAWADTVAALLAPGGFLYLAEFHPACWMLDDETGSRVVRDYFAPDAFEYESSGTYTDWEAPTAHNRAAEWQHTMGDIVSALASAGLRLDFLHEHDFTLFGMFGGLEERDGVCRFPADRPRVPLMYSLKATKP